MSPKRMQTQSNSVALVPHAGTDALSMQDPVAWLGVQPLSQKVATCLRQVLGELSGESLLLLRDPRVQIEVSPRHQRPSVQTRILDPRRLILSGVELKPGARILLLISEPEVRRRPRRETEHRLRHFLGLVLPYLHHPR
jgi:hypothetical protein